uniref:Uncharacterized protein n=1 Tax=Elaeophora elaphi TaxID=1147741 RepID=A0A0R3RLN1_9BILA
MRLHDGDMDGEDTLSGSDNSKRSKRDGGYKSLEKIRLPPPVYHRDGTSFTPVTPASSQRQNYIE